MFEERHSAKQESYLRYKRRALSELSSIDIQRYTASTDGFSNGGEMVEWRTRCEPCLDPFFDLFYSTGERRYPKEVFQRLELLGLAIWYLDDGSCGTVGRKTKRPEVRIHAHALNEEEAGWAALRIRDLTGVQPIFKDGVFRFALSDGEAFLNAVAPFIPPGDMEYKVWGKKCGQELARCDFESPLTLQPLRITEISYLQKEDLPARHGDYVYDIEVEDTHRYFVNGILSSNSNRNEELWDALREGKPIPPPKVPFAYDKFLGYLNAMRVNVKKEGNHLTLVPFTEEQIKQLAPKKLDKPGRMLRGKDLKPEEGGLFDPQITGGREGTRWGRFELAEPMPNPLFEDAIKKLTGLKSREFNAIVRGEQKVDGKTGGAAIEALLKKIDVQKELKETAAALEKAKKTTRPRLHDKLRILKALDTHGKDPTVYMMRSVPVLPPVFRPVTVKADGSLSSDDLNGLYQNLAAVNEALQMNKELADRGLQLEKKLTPMRKELYDGLKAVTGTGGSLTREYQGILDIVAGKIRKPTGQTAGTGGKFGFFQKRLLKRRQDFSARSVITPEPRLGLDEVGLPEDIAWTLYEPLITRMLARQGYLMSDAISMTRKREKAAEHALQRTMEEHPVFLKRDPALHKYNVMAFKPTLVRGKAIQIHPLVTSGYNADFDGDAMAVYLPVRPQAVKEAAKLFPSNNLFSSSTGAVMHTPGHEALLGLYLLSKPGEKTKKAYKTVDDALAAERKGEIKKTDVITVAGSQTTVGRLLIQRALPKEVQRFALGSGQLFHKKHTKDVLTRVAKAGDGTVYGEVVNKLKDLGNEFSTEKGFSIGLEDFSVINRDQRDKMIAAGEAKAAQIRENKDLTKDQQDARIIEVFQAINDELDKLNAFSFDNNPTNISQMVDSGSRGKRSQLKQIVSSPVLLMDAKNRVVPHIIPRSYSEGMDLLSYWTTLHGARKGTIQKVQGVRDPGYLSKQIMNSTMNQLVTEDDCGTRQGVWMSVDNQDVLDRHLASGARLGKDRFRAGALVTPTMLAAARKAQKRSLFVRSPLRCEAEHGICKKCMGLAAGGRSYDIGDNVGVQAGQAIGEPSTQLSLNTFHTGGLAKGKGARSASHFERLQQILRMPKKVPDSAPLALGTGKVTDIKEDPAGGVNVFVGGLKHYVPANQKRTVDVGDTVERGDPLSDGLVDPRKLLPLRGVEAVQDFITKELMALLSEAAPIRQRNVEVVVKALTNVTHVDDSSGHPDWIPGDVRPLSVVKSWNAKNPSKAVEHTPVLKGVDILPLEMQEDWMARLNFQRLQSTITEAAREGWRTNIHGFHPVPAAAAATEFGQGRKALGKEWKGQY